jgi:transcriptional regulator GlxA family with amidase domain
LVVAIATGLIGVRPSEDVSRVQRTLNVAILMFPGVEVLDFAGPFEVFSVASRVASRDGDFRFVPFATQLVGVKSGIIRTRHDLSVGVHSDIAALAPQDVVVIPGGDMAELLSNPAIAEWLVKAHHQSAVTASVCTGALLLAKAGLLDGLVATTHWEDLKHLKTLAPHAEVRGGVPWVDQGHIVTSGGISAGIDMCLHLVERLASADLACRTARQMEYHWRHGAELGR